MDIIKVSAKGSPYNYIDEVKKNLSASGSTELQALQGGIPNALRAAELLIKLGYAQLNKLETSLVEDGKNNEKFSGTAKVVIKLSKASTFDKASKDYENSRASRGK